MHALKADRSLFGVEAVARMIESGATLLLAAEEALLDQLPRGNWIAGTIPYFMSAEQGGVEDHERIFVTRLPNQARVHRQELMNGEALPSFAQSGPDNGFTLLYLPSQSDVHGMFALHGQTWPGLFDRPVVGWVAGTALDRVGLDTAKVYDGASGTKSDTHAAVMHIALPDHAWAAVDTVNLFEQGDGDAIHFDTLGFTAGEARINGQKRRLIDYIEEHGIDTRLPLVADYNGAKINVATARIIEEEGKLEFFAPVFPGITYRFAKPIGDYPALFEEKVAKMDRPPSFSCNCILNYNYADLEGRHTAGITGPMSFGEIAYVLLTQAVVYLTIEGL